MKKKEPIPRICAYCRHAKILATEKSDTPPLVQLLTGIADHTETQLFCPYKKNISPTHGCYRFRFEAVKYQPKPSVAPTHLCEDDLL